MGEYYKSFTVKGNKLGRTIGAPTLNVFIDQPLDFSYGVYVFDVLLYSKHYFAVGTYGFRKSVDNKLSLEVHLLDGNFLEYELYFEKIALRPLKFLREVSAFKNIDVLKEQIQIDKINAINYVKTIT